MLVLSRKHLLALPISPLEAKAYTNTGVLTDVGKVNVTDDVAAQFLLDDPIPLDIETGLPRPTDVCARLTLSPDLSNPLTSPANEGGGR